MKHVNKILPMLFLFIFISTLSYSQNENLKSIRSVALLGGDDGLIAISVSDEQAGQVILFSVKNCEETRRFNYDLPISSIIKLTDNVLLGSLGNKLVIIDMNTGKINFDVEIFDNGNINSIKRLDNNIFAIWSGGELVIVSYNNDGFSIIYRYTKNFNISDVEYSQSAVYISGHDGSLVQTDMNGAAINSFNLMKPIKAILLDEDALFLAMGDELLKYIPRESRFIKLTGLPTEGIAFSSDKKFLSVLGNGMYSIFSYPQMQLNSSKSLIGNDFFVLSNGDAISYDGNAIGIYNQKLTGSVGEIFVLDDALGVISSQKDYYGNQSFRKNLENGLLPNVPSYLAILAEPNRIKACAGMQEVIISKIEKENSDVTQPPKVPSLQTLSIDENVPEIINTINKGSVVKEPVPPLVPTLPEINVKYSEAEGRNVPLWVIGKNLKPYSAVYTESEEDLAKSKIKIREDIARSIMKTMLNSEFIKELPSDDLKKRFLWMVAGRTANAASDYGIQIDKWTSPEGLSYIYIAVDEYTVEQIYKPIFQEESALLQTYGTDGYLSLAPIKWDI